MTQLLDAPVYRASSIISWIFQVQVLAKKRGWHGADSRHAGRRPASGIRAASLQPGITKKLELLQRPDCFTLELAQLHSPAADAVAATTKTVMHRLKL